MKKVMHLCQASQASCRRTSKEVLAVLLLCCLELGLALSFSTCCGHLDCSLKQCTSVLQALYQHNHITDAACTAHAQSTC